MRMMLQAICSKKKGDKIKHICLPAEVSDNVKPKELKEKYINGLLDPVRLDNEVLEEARIDLGSRGYAGQYEQTPASEAGNIVQKGMVWAHLIIGVYGYTWQCSDTFLFGYRL